MIKYLRERKQKQNPDAIISTAKSDKALNVKNWESIIIGCWMLIFSSSNDVSGDRTTEIKKKMEF